MRSLNEYGGLENFKTGYCEEGFGETVGKSLELGAGLVEGKIIINFRVLFLGFWCWRRLCNIYCNFSMNMGGWRM